ncbi:MutS-related protein [Nitrosococcus watsonii]|uniref:DNA mismatch repair protein MutS domain protein n=1 Tax=Nitrosococcus watsoni (strain C-113) TaxID=105559 RepID=D8K6B6_NITWC|nr:DNA mismatch repair protein MutS [Nitrosococcus watsonii]ADJ28443.1 DNA mismatch repair protein MutS domain protein [Nitrosococcus watsonii C-113]
MSSSLKEYLREMIHGIYPPILQGSEAAPSPRLAQPSRVGEGVMDESTFQVIEADRLFDVINTAHTVIGQAVLYRSLAQPLSSIKIIKAKQEALRELASNASLREKIESLAKKAAKREKSFYRLLFSKFTGFFGSSRGDTEIEGYGYATYEKGTGCMLELVKDARALPAPESDYLRILVDDLKEFGATNIYSLMQGPVYVTERGIKTKEEKKWFIPAVKFRPTLFKPLFILAVILGLVALFMYGPMVLGISFSASPILILFLLPAIIFYMPLVGTFDRDSCIYPLQKRYRASAEVHTTLEALGKLDELLAFHHYGKSFGSPTLLPRVIAAKNHTLILREARNPVLGKDNPHYVPNDIDLDGQKLTFISGPNSGGKTAFCKTIAQIQLLSQIGCYVPAEDAEISVADRIFYQVPEISSLEDIEGRFGKELKRTKDMFLMTTPESLIILDELSEGTTHAEKLETSFHVLNGFYRIGNNTLLVTHNHELAERFKDNKIGQYFQVQFIEEGPTYKIIEGISKVSHADRVARKIGFGKEDIERYLKEKGFMSG